MRTPADIPIYPVGINLDLSFKDNVNNTLTAFRDAIYTNAINLAGDYDPAFDYKYNYMAKYEGELYICIKDSTGNLPTNTEYWDKVSEKGKSLEWKGSYNGTTAYKLLDLVLYNNSIYICLQSSTGNLPTDANYWRKLSDGFVPKGNYIAGTTYYPNDVVLYNGSSWVCLTTTVGNTPPALPTITNTWWYLLAQQGSGGDMYKSVYDADGDGRIDELVAHKVEYATDKSKYSVDKSATEKIYINVLNPPEPLVAAKGNANYLNSSNNTWYEDSGFTIPANDDTTAIQACIDYVASLGGGKVVSPICKHYTTDTIHLKDYVIWEGSESNNTDRDSVTNIYYHGTGIAVQTLKPNTPYVDGYNGVGFKGFYIEDVLGTGDIGCDLQGFRWNCIAENISVYGFSKSYHTKHSWYGTHRNILVAGYRTNAYYIESNDNAALFKNCKYSNGATVGLVGAIFGYSNSINIENFMSEGNCDHGIKFDHCNAINASGFYFETSNPAATSAIMFNACKGGTFNGVMINGNSATNRAFYNLGSEGILVNGGYVIGCTNIGTSDGTHGAISLINTYTDTAIGLDKYGYLKVGKVTICYGLYNTAPTAGTWNVGDICHNTTPTRVKNISHWKCITAGTPGAWQAYGTGWGTTAERPSLTANDGGYSYFDTTIGKMILWNGTAWQV